MNRHGIGILIYWLALVGTGLYILHLKNWDSNYILDALLFGIVISIIGSVAFLVLLWMLKPNIKLAERVAQTEDEEGNEMYLFKIINNSRFFALYNIEVNLFKVTQETVEGGLNSRFDHLEVKKNRITRIPHKSKKDSDAFYAQILTCREPLSDHLRRNNTYIELQIMARHALSGFSKVFDAKFHTQACVENGRFAHGDNLSVL